MELFAVDDTAGDGDHPGLRLSADFSDAHSPPPFFCFSGGSVFLAGLYSSYFSTAI